MTGFLASVTSVDEARMVMDAADIIDLKNPAKGALGALPHEVIEGVVRFVDGRKPVSATVGDLPMSPDALRIAVGAMADTGVDIVKVGFFGNKGHQECARALADLTGCCKIVAVLFADQQPDFLLLDTLAASGFYGSMLDTADKTAGNLYHFLDEDLLRQFVDTGKCRNLLTGLAGSLRLSDIACAVKIDPDYLGFRGALCRGHVRQAVLDAGRIGAVAEMLRKCNSSGVRPAVQLQC